MEVLKAMKKSNLLLFVLLLSMVLALAGCAGSDKSDSASDKSASSGSESNDSDDESNIYGIEIVEMSAEDKAALLKTLTPPVGGIFEMVEAETIDDFTFISVYSEDRALKEVSAWYVETLTNLGFVDKVAIDRAEEEKRNKEKLEKNPDALQAPEPEGEPGMDENGEPLTPKDFKGFIQGQYVDISLIQNTGFTFDGPHAGKSEVAIHISWK